MPYVNFQNTYEVRANIHYYEMYSMCVTIQFLFT